MNPIEEALEAMYDAFRFTSINPGDDEANMKAERALAALRSGKWVVVDGERLREILSVLDCPYLFVAEGIPIITETTRCPIDEECNAELDEEKYIACWKAYLRREEEDDG